VSAFDVLERQLRDSARRRPRRRRGLWLVPAIAAAAVALLVLRGPAPPNDERPAAPPVATWTPVLGDARRGHASISRSPVPAAQLRELAVLRRRPTAADRSPVVRALLRYLGRASWHGVRVDAVRLLARHGSQATILVPVERLEGGPGMRDALCLMTGPAGGAGGTCRTLADLHKRGYVGWPGPPFGLVPDGVASVKLRVRGGKTITAPVRHNVYDVRDGGFAIQPPLWLDANGHEIPRR
jgi:hypothetical protein